MEYKINRDYLKDILKMLLTTPSPSGFCHSIMKRIKEEAADLGYNCEETKKGCGIITIPGKASDYTIGLSAHVDTLGAMVRSIKDSGMLRFTSIGDYLMSTVEGEYCKYILGVERYTMVLSLQLSHPSMLTQKLRTKSVKKPIWKFVLMSG